MNHKYKYTEEEKKYLGKCRSIADFKKLQERNHWYQDDQRDINGAILLTRLCGLDFTSDSYYQKIKGKREYKRIYQRPNFTLFLHPYQVYSLPRYPHSKIAIFDIDQRNNTASIEDIVKKLRLLIGDPFYIEYGHKRRMRRYNKEYLFENKPQGAHLYYRFDDYMTDVNLKVIEKRMEQFGYIIESIHGNKTIRLPMTYDTPNYRYFGYEVLNHQPEIKDKRKISLKLKNLEDYFHVYRCFAKKEEKTNRVPIWVHELSQKEKDLTKACKSRVYNPLDISDIGDTYDKNKYIECNIYDETISYTQHMHYNPDRTYGNGTRHIQQIAIGFDILREKGTYQDFKERCKYYNDGTSKDMKLPFEKREKILSDIWKYCTIKFNPISPHYSTGNINGYYHDEDFDLSDDEYEKLERMITYYYIKDHWGKLFGKDQKNFIWNVINLYTQIKQKALHDKISKATYTYSFLKPFEQGIALSQKFIKKICDYYEIKNRHKVMRFLKKYGFIQSLSILVNGVHREYSYKGIRYCKHYIVHTVNDRYNSVKRQFNVRNIEFFLEKIRDDLHTNSYSLIKEVIEYIFIYGNNKDIYINNILYNYLLSPSSFSLATPINNVFKIFSESVKGIQYEGYNFAHAPP